jgi:putative transposase
MSDKFQDKYRIPSARAEWWNYRNDAAYFVTICTAGREHYFGEIVETAPKQKMQLSEMGQVAHQHWMEIPEHFPFIKLDAFVVMPNHVHGILVIDKPINFDNTNGAFSVEALQGSVETLHATSLPQLPQQPDQPPIKNEEMASISPKRGSLSSVIRSNKSAVSKQASEIHADFAWQTRFHDHIIRDEESWRNIQEYILTNPARWNKDKYNIEKL